MSTIEIDSWASPICCCWCLLHALLPLSARLLRHQNPLQSLMMNAIKPVSTYASSVLLSLRIFLRRRSYSKPFLCRRRILLPSAVRLSSFSAKYVWHTGFLLLRNHFRVQHECSWLLKIFHVSFLLLQSMASRLLPNRALLKGSSRVNLFSLWCMLISSAEDCCSCCV